MEDEAGVVSEPFQEHGMFARGVVVDDDVDGQFYRDARHDITQLGDELRVIGQLELTHSVRLQAVRTPDALDRTDATRPPWPWLLPPNGSPAGAVQPRSRLPRARQPLGSRAGFAEDVSCRATAQPLLQRQIALASAK